MPSRPLLPVLGAAVLLVTGLALLVPGTPDSRPPTADAFATPSSPAAVPANISSLVPSSAAAVSDPVPASGLRGDVLAADSPSPDATMPGVMPSGIPAAGDGPAGDRALQAAFSRQHPSDLGPADAEHLVTLACEVWLAETTGQGRERWPAFFPAAAGAGRLYLYADVRVQAAAAHTAGGPDRARVGLLWVGTSPTGEYGDHRPAALTFVRAAAGWEPVR